MIGTLDRKGVSTIVIILINRLDRYDDHIVLKAYRFDNAKEFKSVELALTYRGLSVEFASNYTPEENGVVERFHRTIIITVRFMLQHADLPDGFWPVALLYANYLKNVLPLTSDNMRSPSERWTGHKQLIENERTFGMLCKVHVDKSVRASKLSPTAINGIYPGVHSGPSTQMRVYIPEYGRVEIATKVKSLKSQRATHLLTYLKIKVSTTLPMTLVDPEGKHYDGEEVAEVPIQAEGQPT